MCRDTMELKDYVLDIIEHCKEIGAAQGDILYISSDVTTLTYHACKKCGIKGKSGRNLLYGMLVDELQKLVGEEGTLLFPVFTWSFCRGIPYDVKTTPGEVGALGNWVLENRQDFRRTDHPLYSFMVWGRDADKLLALNNRTAWGADSPFAYMHKNGAKNLIINKSLQGCFTFTHYVEESIGIPCRYFKDFHGEYVTYDGALEKRTYTMFVRDLDIDSKQVTPDDCLVNRGVAWKTKTEDIELQLVDLQAAYPFIEENYRKSNGDEWYDFMGYVIDWNSGQTHPNETTMKITK